MAKGEIVVMSGSAATVVAIAAPDLLYQGQLVTAETYRPLETCTMVGGDLFLPAVPHHAAGRGVRKTPDQGLTA
jgi:ABC-type arginine/histidine transport system permease subunit